MRRNKKDYLIVDGYNIINAWDELKEIAISDLEHAREKLIDAIIEYAEFTGRLGIIVFDAYNIKSCKEKIEKRKNITIVYTKEYQTADSYIEKFIGSLSKYDDVKVATNDYAEQQIVLGKGASRITSRELKLDYNNYMKSLFTKYGELVDEGLPIEDCRYILPYSYHSNIIMGCDANELFRITSDTERWLR